MKYVVLGWVDWFSNETYVYGIYSTLAEAELHTEEGVRWVVEG